MALLNLGILAHVDAGKTSLTERILFETGVIKSVGSVDKGTTQTDTMELERSRGITIKSAVVSFTLNDLKINLIDTPGHTDFVAEVERSLRVLDAVVLVISAVEGVQSQTRRLARAVRDAGLPLVMFINKIDRLGARGEPLLDDIRRKLNLRVIAMSSATGFGERAADVTAYDRNDPAWREPVIDLLAETNAHVIEEFERTGGELSDRFIEEELRAQIASGEVAPVFFGSAITGAGVCELLSGIEAWLPAGEGATETSPHNGENGTQRRERGEPLDGTVFKIDRRSSGEKIVYARLFTGSLAVRQRVALRRRNASGEVEEIEERVTGLDRFAAGTAAAAESASAGEIVVLHGLRTARIDDRLWADSADQGAPGPREEDVGAPRRLRDEIAPAFPRPALESTVQPVNPGQITELRTALEQLAEQDPLISLRQRNEEGEISVRLYGEVQKEILTETLARDYGVETHFGMSQTICIERPAGAGEAIEVMFEGDNPFFATIGFRIEPAEPGSGIRYLHGAGALPHAYYRAVEETAYETLSQGLCGWEVTDCIVKLVHEDYCKPLASGSDFRKLTPMVLMHALDRAGTTVCEPFELLEIDIPEDTFSAVMGTLVLARATIRDTFPTETAHHIICEIPTAELRGVEQQLPGLTRGEGSWITSSAGYVPVTGDPPVRDRIGANPLNRAHYLAEVGRG
jgi:ribosomal protection tetracycline resistance protein